MTDRLFIILSKTNNKVKIPVLQQPIKEPSASQANNIRGVTGSNTDEV